MIEELHYIDYLTIGFTIGAIYSLSGVLFAEKLESYTNKILQQKTLTSQKKYEISALMYGITATFWPIFLVCVGLSYIILRLKTKI